MKYIYSSVLALILCVTGCGDTDGINTPYPDETRQYFPLETGRYIVYEVDSTIFDDAPGGNTFHTVSFQIKEEVGEIYSIDGKDTTYLVQRYRRPDAVSSWTISDVWTASSNTAEALRTEENLTFRKLIFPLRFGRRWIGTSYINPNTAIRVGTEMIEPYELWEAEVTRFDRADSVGVFQFGDGQVMEVLQSDSDDDLMRRVVREKYVRNVGMVERHEELLDSRCIDLGDFGPCLGKPWIEHATRGYILSQVMIEYH